MNPHQSAKSLAEIFGQRKRRKRPQRLRRERPPPLYIEQILAWADDHYKHTGQWPTCQMKRISGTLDEKWCNVDQYLRRGWRGLPGHSSLACLLAERRGVRNHKALPPYSIDRILVWADAHHRRTGEWPTALSGALPAPRGETWRAIDSALKQGLRGLPGGSSLARVLAEHRGVRNPQDLSQLTLEEVLTWADAHHRRTGHWPLRDSGQVPEAPGETWHAVDNALHRGSRGLSGGSSLAQVLQHHRGVRNRKGLPELTLEMILVWADDHHQRTGEWPGEDSGAIALAPEETWRAVDSSLRQGARGQPGGSSLVQVLQKHRGARNKQALATLTTELILGWAEAHHHRTGDWPDCKSGPILEAPGESWLAVNASLRMGYRDLPGGSSLAQLLAEQRGVRNHKNLPKLTVDQILRWADDHHQCTGAWPFALTGSVALAPTETWQAVDMALRSGGRGLPRGSSLAQLLRRYRGYRPGGHSSLTVELILEWAALHYQRTGRWPGTRSGPVVEAPGISWKGVNRALSEGLRGLPGGSSLSLLLATVRLEDALAPEVEPAKRAADSDPTIPCQVPA